jgi:hypothetical protein
MLLPRIRSAQHGTTQVGSLQVSGDMANTSDPWVGGKWMSWLETDPVLERHHFVQDVVSGHWTMPELCTRYGPAESLATSGSTATGRVASVVSRSTARLRGPVPTRPTTRSSSCWKRTAGMGGTRKILRRLQTRDPKRAWPARSTIFDILKRNGRVEPRRRRRHWKPSGVAPLNTTAPNQIWTVDFKASS